MRLLESANCGFQTMPSPKDIIIKRIQSKYANDFVKENQNGVEAGTVIFDPYEVNGAILPIRNGQLKVLLNDGVFHPITNT